MAEAPDSPQDEAPDLEVAPDRSSVPSLEMLRAMAHPLRMQIMELVGRDGTARAADLARALDVPANSISYHLRTLARSGVIVEAPDAARDKRDRVWRLAQSTYSTEAGAEGASASHPDGYEEAVVAVGAVSFEMMRTAWLHAATANDAHSAHRAMVNSTVRLSEAQAKEFSRSVTDLIIAAKDMNRDASGKDLAGDPDSDEPAHTFHVHFALVPSATGERTDKGGDGASGRA